MIVTAVAAVHASAQGQVREVPDTAAVHVQADSAAIVRYMSYDSLMTYLKGQVRMSDSLTKAIGTQVEKNKSRRAQGYRLRILFDNSQ